LIGRNHDLISQLLKNFEDGETERKQKKKKKKYSVKGIANEQEYDKSAKRKRMID